MKKMMIAAMVFAAQGAFADGFNCQSVDGKLNVKVYNHVQPTSGTRNSAVLVFSDSTVNAGNKTIAKFTAEKGTLENEGTTYTADVDLRFSDSSRKGELIAGTKLGYLDQINLDIDFSYAHPVAAGVLLLGELDLVKRNGSHVSVDLVCERYLKN